MQSVLGKERLPYPDLITILVHLADEADDEFYVMRLKELQDRIYQHYAAYLREHEGRRPNKPRSTHTVIRRPEIQKFRDNWTLLGASDIVRIVPSGAEQD